MSSKLISALPMLAVPFTAIACAVPTADTKEDTTTHENAVSITERVPNPTPTDPTPTDPTPTALSVNIAAFRSVVAQGAIEGSPGKLTDTQFAPEGTYWHDLGYAVVTPPGSALIVDLASAYPICELVLQSDCNDRYRIEASRDGATWQTVHEFGAAAECPGLRTRPRIASSMPASARYLRVTGGGGDALYSVSELQAFVYFNSYGCMTCTPNEPQPNVYCK